MKHKQTKGTAGKVVAYIVLLLVIIAALGAVACFTDGFTADFKTFYLSVDGKEIKGSSGDYVLVENQTLTVDIKRTLLPTEGGASDYTVRVVPNTELGRNFDFTLDGDVYSFLDEPDLTQGFVIEKGEDSFTLTPKGNLGDILGAVYPSYEVGDCDGRAYDNMFRLVVTPSDGGDSISLTFTVKERAAGVTLDPTEIVF